MADQNNNEFSRRERFDEVRQIKHKKNRVKRWILYILLAVVLGVVGWGTYLYTEYKSSIDSLQQSAKITKVRDVSSLIAQGKPFSILILGTDTGELDRDRTGLSDSMMVATINPKSNKVTMVSIPRDIMTAIPGDEGTFPQKLNAAYSLDGVGASMKAVQNYLNVPIDSYALVNMKGLETLVKKVGGVSVKSPLSFQYSQATAHDYGPDLYRFHKGSTSYEYSSDNGATWSSSKTVMDGDAALAFSRMRYDDPQGDYGRQQRQRLVLEAMLKKAVNIKTLVDPSFIKAISKNAKTDLDFNDIVKIAQKYRGSVNNQVSDHLQGQGIMYDGVSYQMVPTTEKQRVTNLLRSQLGLKQRETGSQFASDVPTSEISTASYILSQIDEKFVQ
ncbi:LCP family glycopolymer transferase [Fructobacillus ficulneus]|uniref:Cell envelope-associated transcriptional attenuator LytR-CpsA-Psr n=1 Tax=Fructobacillus ficulneus TaxID=157463 RepID=A0A0K8MFG4_9LACO|nr:LCP family protein [Fructobacillus ficulneus]GAO99250.1 cell envelope-associated transcriptional attenuator LytR-CpsA-Psr [Fructobacillus ficulneus]